MLRRLLAIAILALSATPASADTTAVYRSAKFGGEMTVEIASNGNLRGTMGGRGDYVLTIGGEGYFVFFTAKGVVVDRASDIAGALGDYVREKMPEFGKFPDFEGPTLVEGGRMTVRGRAGTIWYTSIDGAILPAPTMVISSDPALRELGRAVARQFEMSTLMMAQMLGRKRNMMTATLDVLNTGAPLLFAGMELVSVTDSPIAADRFALPAEPETPAQVRARLEANGGHIP